MLVDRDHLLIHIHLYAYLALVDTSECGCREARTERRMSKLSPKGPCMYSFEYCVGHSYVLSGSVWAMDITDGPATQVHGWRHSCYGLSVSKQPYLGITFRYLLTSIP